MRRMFLLFQLFLSTAAFAQQGATISGEITNATTGGSVKADWIVLVQTGAGLTTLQQVEQVSRYEFTGVPVVADAPYLVRAMFQGVLYTQTIMVQDSKPYVVDLTVYNSTSGWADISVRIPHLIVVKDGPHLEVQETFEIQNSGKLTYHLKDDKTATFRFRVPAGATLGQVMTSHNRSMPVAGVVLEHGDEKGVNFPLRPGISQIQITYTLEYVGAGTVIRNRWYYDIAECNIFVSPADMRLLSDRFHRHEDAQLAASDFAVYAASSIVADEEVSIELTGGSETRGSSGQDQVVAHPSRIQNMVWVLIPSLLAVCMLALYVGLQKRVTGGSAERAPTTSKAEVRRSQQQRKDLAHQQEMLAGRIAQLDDRYEAQQMERTDYEQQRSDLKRQLLGVTRALAKH